MTPLGMPPAAALAPVLLVTSQRRSSAPLSCRLLVGSAASTNTLVAGGFSLPLVVVMILMKGSGQTRVRVGESG